jgi:tRNA(fMet)-specific endonuclease VapC
VTYLIDTNIVSYVLKRNINVDNKFREARRLQQDIFISCITYYEVQRGLSAINATRQLADFSLFCNRYQILFLDDIAIIEKACEIHVYLKNRGAPVQDADILIAATAMTRGLILVSNDTDLLRIPGINLENWATK